ncbi:hypothetical protein FNV43_RR09119 [Rhamnella rubrinervis]|uniref:Cytochrome P450 n=1 Tax=Rhamnella rubrinervis TaxID=2594499 RepID=A0A8K0H9W2_9ROSA|nr:hypothetical protein FNV43_RR09119 [Rhamnella rubrinervis]
MEDYHSSWLLLAVSVVMSTILAKLWLLKRLKTEKVTLPPGPQGLPIVGYLPYLGANLHQTFMELAQVHGPIYKLSIGQKLCVIISSPSLIKEVVKDQDSTFANRNPNIAALAFSFGGNDIAFAPYGPQWRLLRKIFVREMLSHANLNTICTVVMRNEIEKCIGDVYSKLGQPIDIGELAFLTVINSIASMFWGGTLKGEEATRIGAEFRRAVLQLVVMLGKPNISDFFPPLARFDLQGIKRDINKAMVQIDKIFDFVIGQGRKSGPLNVDDHHQNENGGKDFLQVLLEFKDQDSGRSISTSEIKAMLMDIVIGGTDTTSTMVEWTMTELMQHPNVLRKSQEEIKNVVGSVDKLVEDHQLNKLTYLQAVVKESLRLHPVAPLLLPRCPTKSCTVGGYTIPKGTKVFLNVWAVHRDPEFWDNPCEFRPERFLGSEEALKLDYTGNNNNFKYLPFGGGRRICAGLPLGERMLMNVLASLLHCFHWKLPDGHAKLDCEEKLGVVLEKSTPLVAVPVLPTDP